SEEHTSELQSPVVISYAVFCLKKKKRLTKSTVACSDARTFRSCLYAELLHLVLLFLPVDRLHPDTLLLSFFFFNDTATTEIYTTTDTLSLHDALPISISGTASPRWFRVVCGRREPF